MVAKELNGTDQQPPGLRRAEGGLRLLRDLGRAARPGGGRLHHAETLAEEGAQRRVEVRRVVTSQTEIDSPQRLEKIWIWCSKIRSGQCKCRLANTIIVHRLPNRDDCNVIYINSQTGAPQEIFFMTSLNLSIVLTYAC